MSQCAVGHLAVAGPLKGQLLVGMCAGPDRDNELGGLKVEVVAGMGQRAQGVGKRRIEKRFPGDGREADTFVQRLAQSARGDIAHVADAFCQQQVDDAAAIRQVCDRILG